MISIVIASFVEKEINPRKYMRIHTPTVVKGGVGGELDGTPPQSILYVAVFRNDFAFVESLSSSRQDRYILWVVALLEVCDITKKWSLSWILQRITN